MTQSKRDVEACRPNVYRQQVSEIDKALNALRGAGIDLASSPFAILERERAKLLSNIGVKMPRSGNLLVRYVGFSPGVIALFHDNEAGFIVEARTSVQAPPVYHLVPEDMAMRVLKHDISDELEEFLMTPELDIDN